MRRQWKRALAAGCLAAGLAIPMTARADETHGIPNASFPEKGILAAGQPTGEQLQILAEDGYKTVIDLRPDTEPRGYDEVGAAKQNGLTYVSIPVTGATLDRAAIDRFVTELDKAQRPVIIHCATSSRVGALYYAWLREKGMPKAEALAKGKAAGLRSQELIEKVDAALAEGEKKPKG
jgi:uncharacterized protein (TIGR01244 family)